ncbi:methylmalonyl-CoA mutase family protein [Solicola sp. PLA-1-18]|uniref:methylmalonyl-CoA mutase family protein n=1 Tax=Solicola sp. PLA-1-18 TaxID=3380532 RepID=UPI003B7B5437
MVEPDPVESPLAEDEALRLAPGDAPTQEQWEAAAAAVLRKARRLQDDDPDADVWGKLTRRTLDDVDVPPLGTAASVADLPQTGLPGQAPFTRGTSAARTEEGWDVRVLLADPALTNQVVLDELEHGVTSLWLRAGEGAVPLDGLDALLDGVFLDLAPVVLDAPDDPLAAADALAAVLADRSVEPHPGTNLGADPIGSAVRHGRDADADAVRDVVTSAAARARDLGTLALVVDATVVHDRGASSAQELGWATAVGAAYLRLLVADGLDVDDALALLEFRFAATDEQLTTIAKLRAARRLWHRVAELAGAGEASRGQRQHAVTSRAMTSRHDPYVNMLRTTVATFSAGVGGASAVTVLPFDAAIGHPDAFSRRIARNTSALLVEESHVAAVTDPAGGSYAVEQLTDGLARAGWDELGRIDEAGGVLAALADGSLLGRVEQTAERRRAEVATRTRPLTGVSEFPNLHETLPDRAPDATGGIGVERWAEPFEQMRDARASTPAFLATMGTVAQHTARATFAANLFAAGGVDTVTAGPTEGPDDVVAAWTEAGRPPVACLAGHDRTYAEWGEALVAALREAGASWVVVAGKPIEGTDDSAAVGVDAVAFLGRAREQLEVTA